MMASVALRPMHPDDLHEWTSRLVTSLLSQWPDADDPNLPPRDVREAVVKFGADLDAADTGTVAAWSAPSGRLADLLEPVLESLNESAAPDPVRGLLPGLYSALKRSMWSPQAQEVFRQSDAVSRAAALHGASCHINELLAALNVVEDAAMAIEGYSASPPFLHNDEAYLAKYGLLQALQVGLDAAETVGRCAGQRFDAWKAGGKTAIEARTIVAGHPVGGTMRGEKWLHFHDRGSSHEKAVIRVMSFSRDDPEKMTGQTILTDDLMMTGLTVMADLLRKSAENLTKRSAE